MFCNANANMPCKMAGDFNPMQTHIIFIYPIGMHRKIYLYQLTTKMKKISIIITILSTTVCKTVHICSKNINPSTKKRKNDKRKKNLQKNYFIFFINIFKSLAVIYARIRIFMKEKIPLKKKERHSMASERNVLKSINFF